MKFMTSAGNKQIYSRKEGLKPKRGHHSDNPTYLSGTYTEYYIKSASNGHYYIKKHQGGKLPKQLEGSFTNYKAAERILIQWLEKTDVRRQSRYPGCPERRITNYILTHLPQFANG